MQTTTRHTTSTSLHAAIMAAAAVAPGSTKSDEEIEALYIRAGKAEWFFSDGLSDNERTAFNASSITEKWLHAVQEERAAAEAELAEADDAAAPHHVTFRHATGSIKLRNTRERLTEFASELVRHHWALYGGGQKPEAPKKARKTTWPALLIKVFAEQVETGSHAEALDLATSKLNGTAYDVGNGPFLTVAPQPVDDLPNRLKSVYTDSMKWLVIDTVTGYSIGQAKWKAKHNSRKAAEDAARKQWFGLAEETRQSLYTKTEACNTHESMLDWCAKHGFEPAASEAEPMRTPAEAVADVVAGAMAAAAIDAAQESAAAAELAQVADTQADTVADVAADVVADVAELAEVVEPVAAMAADVVATMGGAPGTGAPGHTGHTTPTQRSTGTPGAAGGASGAGGQRVAGKSGRWVATFHTTAAGLPGMLYTGPDGVASVHEFDTGSQRMAALQRMARAADATPPATHGQASAGSQAAAEADAYTGSQRMARAADAPAKQQRRQYEGVFVRVSKTEAEKLWNAGEPVAMLTDKRETYTTNTGNAEPQNYLTFQEKVKAGEECRRYGEKLYFYAPQAAATPAPQASATEADTGHAMATDARLQHLARAFDPAGVDVWQCAAHELQAMPPADYVALLQHLENINHHTAHLAAQCKRAGRVDLARVCEKIERAHLAAGQLTYSLSLARQAVANILGGRVDATSQATEWGEALAAAQAQAEADAVAAAAQAQADAMQRATPGTAEADTGHATQAQAAQACAPAASAYPQANGPAAPYTPPAAAAAAQATHPVCAADATDYTDPLKTSGQDYTHPLKTLPGALAITITRGEGPTELCGIPHTVASFAEADALLTEWADTVRPGGSCDKVDFSITWPDGSVYAGCYELQHHATERPSLARHMVDLADFYTGKGCPAHMSEAAYLRHMEHVSADTRAAYEEATRQLNAAGIHTGKARPVSVDLRELVALGMPVADLVGLGVTYCGDAYTEPQTGAIVDAEAIEQNPRFYRVGLMGRDVRPDLAAVPQIRVTVRTECGAEHTAHHDDFGHQVGARYRLDQKRHGAPYLAQLAAAVAMRTAQATAAKELEAKAHADELARLAVEFAHLERADGTHGGGTFAARNIRTELKRAFPGVKFSVKSDYSSVGIRWTDGPTEAQVCEVVGRFDIGASDSQADYFYTVKTAFSELFGGVQYLNTHRETSDALTAEAIAEFWAAHFAGVADAPAMPTPADWRNATGFFDWRADNWQACQFRDHLTAKAGPMPTAIKTTRKAKA